ncbi:MAG TPA: tetratricopeptide repeat protein [Terriglobales bacterium]|nr:tetratricopeptide repeat protein [Terriglobales bacterium]
MDKELSNQEKIRFNTLYDKANELMRDKISSKGQVKQLSAMEQIELAEAVAFFKECIKIYPASWQSMWAIGLASQMLGETEDALEWFNRAYQINPAIKTMFDKSDTK